MRVSARNKTDHTYTPRDSSGHNSSTNNNNVYYSKPDSSMRSDQILQYIKQNRTTDIDLNKKKKSNVTRDKQ